MPPPSPRGRGRHSQFLGGSNSGSNLRNRGRGGRARKGKFPRAQPWGLRETGSEIGEPPALSGSGTPQRRVRAAGCWGQLRAGPGSSPFRPVNPEAAAARIQGYCRRQESTSPSSGPACPSPVSSSSTNLFSSYSSTSTFRNRADDTVFFDIPDPDRRRRPPLGAALSTAQPGRSPQPGALTSLFRSGASPAIAARAVLGVRARRAPPSASQLGSSHPHRPVASPGSANERGSAPDAVRRRRLSAEGRGGAKEAGAGGGGAEGRAKGCRGRGKTQLVVRAYHVVPGVSIETLPCGPVYGGLRLAAMATGGGWPCLLLPPPATCHRGPV